MRFKAVPEFLAVYDRLAGRELEAVIVVLERLLVEHESSWARQGRIRGEPSAWIVLAGEWRLYWAYRDEETVLLLALMRRR